MGDTKPPNNMLDKANHTNSNIVTGLDQIRSQHPNLYVGFSGPTTFLARSYLAT